MKIVDYIIASVFNSSFSAIKLASDDSKYIPFAKEIISAKNIDACCRLIMSVDNYIDFFYTYNKIIQYNSFLNILDSLELVSDLDYFYSDKISDSSENIAKSREFDENDFDHYR